ncbi:MAG: phytase [Acidimicrobiia bacterium]|nr:phytase [Acidimicrobiia bacterium]
MRLIGIPLLLCVAAVNCAAPADGTAPAGVVAPVSATDPVGDEADDPAIWINRLRPAESLILGTNKVPAPRGALAVFDLNGRIRQIVEGLDRPNNVDVEYDVVTPRGQVDIAVVTEQLQRRLRVFRVAGDGVNPLDGGVGLPVLEGEAGERGMPMGVGVYRRPSDGAVFAIVAPKAGGPTDYLWQYRLEMPSGSSRMRATLVRRFGAFSGSGEIEAVFVDDELGYVYYADDAFAIHKWHADPDHPDAGTELAVFGQEDFWHVREGIAMYPTGGGKGFLLCTDRRPGGSMVHLYTREGSPGRPHEHRLVRSVPVAADDTDGLDASAAPLGPSYPQGIVVAMNSGGRNFQVYSWEDLSGLKAPGVLTITPTNP